MVSPSKQTYYVTAPPNAEPWAMRDALDRYQIDTRYRAMIVYTNGSTRDVNGFDELKKPAERLMLVASIAVVIASGFILPPVVFAASVSTGGGLGVATGIAGGVAASRLPVKVPSCMLIEVEFRDVSIKRIEWAEYALVTWCLLKRWEMRGELLQPRNLVWAQNRLGRLAAEGKRPDMPTPWSSGKRSGKRNGKRKTKDKATGKAREFGKWLWG